MNVRRRIALAIAAALAGATGAVTLAPTPAGATPPAPVILNNGSQNGTETQWAETQGLPDDGGVRNFFATFLVQHAPGRTITHVRADVNFDVSDNTTNATTNVAVTGQTLVLAGGGIETSRVTVSVPVGKPNGFACPFIGTRVRTVDAPIRMRVVDSTSEVSATTLSTIVRFVEDSNCLGSADFPRLLSASQNLTEVTPGTNITYSFSCDDVDGDVFSSDDDCDRANIRWRRLNDGTTSAFTLKTGIDDNTGTTHVMNFPSRGYYVVEAQLGNEDGSFPNAGNPTQGFVRLGNAVVNDSALSSLSGSLSFSGSEPSTPPSVNPGTAVNAVAAVGDTGGTVQAIEWDNNGSGTYTATGGDTRFYTIPAKSGGDIVTPALDPLTQLRQTVNTSTAGLKTVNARITDNGALDAADNIRRQLEFGRQLRVNAIPTAANVSASTTEDHAVNITLGGIDTDNQPDPLIREIVAAPAPAQGSVGAVSGNQVTFTPTSNFNGIATFTYRVRDGSPSTIGAWSNSNTATVTVNVGSVNDVPVVDPHSATTNEDTPVHLFASGTDVEDGINLTYAADSDPPHGSVSCTPSGDCTYSPDLDFFGTDTFVVRGTDQGTGGPAQSSTATFTVTVNPINDAPVPDNDTVNVPEDAVNFAIDLNATDVDSLVLAFAGPVDDVDHGTISCLADTCTYSPAPDYNGADSFTFTVNDGALTSTGTITINVTAVNDAPIATDVDTEVFEDAAITLTLGGTDVDNDPMSVLSLTNPPHGTAVQAGPGPNDATYQGDLNFNGIDSFDFTISDGALSDIGTVTVTVKPVNDAPVVADQSFGVTEDVAGILSLLASDVDGDALTWSIVTPPTSGSLLGSGPDVAYVPAFNFHGTDTFVVRVTDPGLLTDTAVITVVVAPVNDQPEAIATSVTTSEDDDISFSLNADDIDGDTLTYSAPEFGPFHGGVVCGGSSCTYTPLGDFNGSDLITFSVDDGNGGSDSASVSITVTPVNDAPVASYDAATFDEDTTHAFNLFATDVDGDLLTYTTTSPANGTLIGVAPNVVYVPNANAFGPDSFSFTVNDGHLGTSSASVDIVVMPVNDAPVATGGTASTDEDTAVTFQLGGTDVDSASLSYNVISPPAVGILVCNAAGACSYTPATDDSGTYAIGYTVSDGSLDTNGVFTILVAPVNDPPAPASSSAATSEDTALPITLNATDTEGDALTYNVVAPPAHGTLLCTTNSCVYTPTSNYNGPDSFVWSADDGHAGAVNATVSIAVSAVNDAPVALDTSSDTDEEAPVMFNLLGDDVDGDTITYTVDTAPAHGTLTVTPAGVATYTPAVDYNGVDTFLFKATDPHGAFSVAHGTVTITGLPLIASTITPVATTAEIQQKLGQPINNQTITVLNAMKATLKVRGTTIPLPGRTIYFKVSGTFICSAVTNAQGVGQCGAAVAGIANEVQGGYRAFFDGDADYAASNNHSPLTVQVKIKP